MIEHAGSDILAAYLISTGVVTLPSLVRPWPMSVSSMPSTTPDEYTTCYDTTGRVDGRYMKTGKTIDHPGFLIRFRGRVFRNVQKKAMEVFQKLDEIKMNSQSIGAKNYIIQSTKRTTTLISLGPEEGTGRLLYTVNGIMTFFEA